MSFYYIYYHILLYLFHIYLDFNTLTITKIIMTVR